MRFILIFSIISMLFTFKRSSIFKPLISLQADGTMAKKSLSVTGFGVYYVLYSHIFTSSCILILVAVQIKMSTVVKKKKSYLEKHSRLPPFLLLSFGQ